MDALNLSKATTPRRIRDIPNDPPVQFVVFVESSYSVDDGSNTYTTNDILKPHCFYTKEHLQKWIEEEYAKTSYGPRPQFKVFAVKPMPVTVKTVVEFGE